MSFSSGTFSLVAGNPVVTGTTISSTTHNNTETDIATGLSTCVLKDGTQTITANIPMATYIFTGLGAGSAAGHSLRYQQLFTTSAVTLLGAMDMVTGANIASAATINLTTATGNAVHVTGTTTITAVTLGTGIWRLVIFDGALTLTHSATTNNLPGTANITTAANDRALYWSDGTTVYCVAYQKANGQPTVNVSLTANVTGILPTANGGTGIAYFTAAGPSVARVYTFPDAAATMLYAGGTDGTPIGGITMNTARLLGRTTASTGETEEITVGAGLSMSSLSLTAVGVTGVVDIRTSSATITIPTSASKLKVTLVGAGGGSGGVAASSVLGVSGVGGPGAGLIKYLSGLTAGNTLALTIGAAGAGGAAGQNNGTAGGNTILASGTETITTLTAAGGALGTGAAANGTGTHGAAGTATNGDLNLTGQTTHSDPDLAYHVFVGNPPLGFGFAAFNTSGNAAGIVGTGYGVGGSNANDSASTNRAGAAGTAGLAIFEWYV